MYTTETTNSTTLRRSINGHKGYLKTLFREAATLEAATPLDHSKLLSKVTDIKKRITFLEELNLQIQGIMTDTEFEEFFVTSETHISRCWHDTAKLEKLISDSSNDNERPPRDQRPDRFPKVNLPKLTLPIFSGDLLKWTPFWDSFSASIDNSNMDSVQKFTYLKAHLSGEAALCVSGLMLTRENYSEAITILKERYGKSHVITKTYMKAIVDLPPPEYNHRSLLKFYDDLQCYIRVLKSHGKTEESYGDVLLAVLTDRLPSEVRKNVARKVGDNEWTFKAVLDQIQAELLVLEAGDPKPSTNSTNRETKPSANTSESTTSALLTAGQSSHTSSRTGSTSYNARPQKSCRLCKQHHTESICDVYATTEARHQRVRELRLCWNCLGNHISARCRSYRRCRQCSSRHHTSLCDTSSDTSTPQCSDTSRKSTASGDTHRKSTETSSSQKSTSVNLTSSEMPLTTSINLGNDIASSVLLKTAVIRASSAHCSTDCNVLFDDGAQRTFIRKSMADELQLVPITSEMINLSNFGATKGEMRQLDCVNLNLHCDDGTPHRITALVVPDIALPIGIHERPKLQNYAYLNGLKLAHPVNREDRFAISLLIGLDHYYNFVLDEHIRDPLGNGPTAVLSKFGFIISGPLSSSDHVNAHSASILNILIDHQEPQLKDFWELETLGIEPPGKEESNNIDLAEFSENCITFASDSKRYVACLPWKSDHAPLQTNYNICYNRTRSTVNRLIATDHLAMYSAIIQEQENRGFIERVPDATATDTDCHYIPHHAVFRSSSSTTPIRIVYDCSCKPYKDAPSLNDCLNAGPPMQNDISQIFIRFRLFQFAAVADVEKAFLQILLHDRDKDFTRFLWLRNPNDPDSELITFRFRVVLFGASCSPFLLNSTIWKHLLLNPGKTSDIIRENVYVDNVLASFPDDKSALEFYSSSRNIMNDGGFNLRCWNTNNPDVRDHAAADDVLENKDIVTSLGHVWNSKTDELAFKPVNIYPPASEISKRTVLSDASKLFDPLGLIAPVSVRAKVLLQMLWKQKSIDWDDYLPIEFAEIWNEIAYDIQKSSYITMPRSYFSQPFPQNETVELHVFGDASKKAYGAAAYLVTSSESTLVMAKTRVAPIKELTIPQLELMAASLAARLANHITTTLQTSLQQGVKRCLWTDSQIVLGWIRSSKKLTTFVGNRVKEIRSLTDVNDWRYCPSEENPADMLSRGITVSVLGTSTMWFHGPSWLTEVENRPSKPPDIVNIVTCISETTENSDNVTDTEDCSNLAKSIDINRFSSLSKLLRVTVLVLRFIHNLRNATKRRGSIDLTELQHAEKLWIDHVQRSTYENVRVRLLGGTREKIAIVQQLQLFLDKDSIIRCRGRIQNSTLDDDAKFPVLLPKTHYFASLVIRDYHQRLLHSGVNATITAVRHRYWIPCIRQLVKCLLRSCVTCKKVIGRPYRLPDPAPLPSCRVADVPCFHFTGIDFCGPLYVISYTVPGTSDKSYICLFTCATSRAIHLELLPNLNVDSFMQALRRFISRRSIPHQILSDNASTFYCAADEINEIFRSDKVRDFLTSKGIDWKFIIKRAPWQGGFWERLIGLTKTVIKKTLGSAKINFEELRTLLTEVEAVLNDRPLTYASDSASDFEPLTPSHLLIGKRITALPHVNVDVSELTDPEYVPDQTDLQRRAKYRAALIKQFRDRWTHEYLVNLRESHRVTGHNTEYVKSGVIVIIHDDCPRVRWKLGLITSVHRGPDGYIRSATLRTANGVTNRPISKLYPLEVYTVPQIPAEDNTIAERTEEETPTPARPTRRAAVEARKNIMALAEDNEDYIDGVPF